MDSLQTKAIGQDATPLFRMIAPSLGKDWFYINSSPLCPEAQTMPFGLNCTSSEKTWRFKVSIWSPPNIPSSTIPPLNFCWAYTKLFTLTVTHAIFSSPMSLSSCCRLMGLLEAETIEYTLCACHFGTGAMQTEVCEFIQWIFVVYRLRTRPWKGSWRHDKQYKFLPPENWNLLGVK